MSDTPIITYEQIMKMFRASARASAKRMAALERAMEKSREEAEKRSAAMERAMDKSREEAEKRSAAMERAMDKSRAEAEKSRADFDRRFKKISEQYGGFGNTLGNYAEWSFRDALTDSKELAGIHFDKIFTSGSLAKGNVQDEFDIVMVNGEYVALIEVKFTVHAEDLKKLLKVKREHFRFFFPEYANHKLLLALAGEVFSDAMLRKVQDSGVIAVKEKPGAAEVFADKMRTF